MIVYSDASVCRMRSGLGFVVIDQESGKRFLCPAVRQPWFLASRSSIDRASLLLHEDLRSNDKQQQHINALELLALAAAVWTCGEQIFRDRQVSLFSDNTAALSMAVSGCAKSPHLAALSNTLHSSLACLQCQSWSEWVPSDANPADILQGDEARTSRPFTSATVSIIGRRRCAFLPLNSRRCPGSVT